MLSAIALSIGRNKGRHINTDASSLQSFDTDTSSFFSTILYTLEKMLSTLTGL